LLHVSNKQNKNIIIILVLVDVVREPILECLTYVPQVTVCSLGAPGLVWVIFVLQTFKSHHDGKQHLLHVPNKHTGTIAIILVLVDVGREPIQRLK
jgi:hypothetical protein